MALIAFVRLYCGVGFYRRGVFVCDGMGKNWSWGMERGSGGLFRALGFSRGVFESVIRGYF